MIRIPREHQAEVGALYREFGRELLSFAGRLLHNESDAAPDLTQEVFQAAAQRWDRLRGLDRDAQRAWLFRVLKHKVFDHWGAARRHVPVSEVPETAADQDASREALSHLLLQRCWRMIDAMPPAQRRVALLRWQGEWTTREIAEHLALSPSTVRVHLRNARRVLVEEFGTEVVFPSDWWEKTPGEEVAR
ncbi:RNA polymerase sigma factor [Streptomyces sp. NPDC052236]|uniref:RNA polymerase sigma factor n=1 Tax=Streptomyces sp. NPDC052236 TaxID=3365686 RepID=UPI0037D3E581